MSKQNRAQRRVIMKGELRDVKVDLVSVLFDGVKPANGKGVVVKSADGKNLLQKGSNTKFKADHQGRIYVTVMEPGVKDGEGDFYTAGEVQKACDHFAIHGMVGRNDINHNHQPTSDLRVSENYILKAADPEHFPNTALDSWVQVLKCDDLNSELWKKVEKGDMTGVSIFGVADDAGDTDKTIKAMKDTLNNLVQVTKGMNDSMFQSALANTVSQMTAQLDELRLNGTKQQPQLAQGFAQLQKGIDGLTSVVNRAISKSIHGEPGQDDTDREVTIAGTKVTVKSSHREIYKGIADIDRGKSMNILTPNTTGLFIDEVVNSKGSDTLSDITVAQLTKDESFDVGLVSDLVFKNKEDGKLTAQDVVTKDLKCQTGILNAELVLGRDTVEFYKDKYGEEAFAAYVEQHMAKKAEKAVRLLLFQGDRASETASLKPLDGLLKIMVAADKKALSTADYATWADRFEAALLEFDSDKLEEQESMVIYVSHHDLIRIRKELSARETARGDALLLEGGKVSFNGIPVKPRLLPDNNIVMGLKKFIILGYRTDAELLVDFKGDDWSWHWYIRIRPGITYLPGFVKLFTITTPQG